MCLLYPRSGPVAPEGLRVIDFSGALLDQTYAVQVWALANALFVWMGPGAAKPALRYASLSHTPGPLRLLDGAIIQPVG